MRAAGPVVGGRGLQAIKKKRRRLALVGEKDAIKQKPPKKHAMSPKEGLFIPNAGTCDRPLGQCGG
jgi:hypothetical protein